MAITHDQKVTILDVLTNNVATQKSVLFLTTKNTEEPVDAATNQKFRMAAREKGVMIQIIKNTLIKRVFPNLPELNGQTYVAYLFDGQESDEVTVAKGVVDLVSKDFKMNFDYVGSVVVGEFYDKTQTIKLAKTPTKEESMAQLAGALNQITAKIAIGVKEIPTGVARGVSEYSKTLS
jgi:large subunit ribosomal protein L10